LLLDERGTFFSSIFFRNSKTFSKIFFGFMFVVDGRIIFFLKFSRQNNIR